MTVHRLAQVVALLVLAAAEASAQTPRRDSLTLYELPDYRGGSVTFYGDNANVGSTGFTSKAQSAQVIGAWRVCTGGGYRGRCERLDRNVRDLSAYGLARQVGSVRADALGTYAPPPAPPAAPARQPYPAASERRAPAALGAVAGLTTIFFARPLIGDLDVSATRVDAADRFCRSQGASFAIYFDRSRNAPRAVEPDAGVVGPGPVLSDVLCRRY